MGFRALRVWGLIWLRINMSYLGLGVLGLRILGPKPKTPNLKALHEIFSGHARMAQVSAKPP